MSSWCERHQCSVLPILGTDPHASRETETLKVETLKAETLEAEIGKQEAHDGQDGALGEHALPGGKAWD